MMMKSWNLLHFDEVVRPVLSPIDKDATAVIPSMRRKNRPLSATTLVGTVSAVVLVTTMSFTPVRVNVSGSDDALRISSYTSTSNFQNDQPPLALLFGGNHTLKWDAAKEQEMLARAAAAVACSSDRNNEANLIHSVLRENLPRDRDEADDLASMGIKLG
jgi:hypothetical protein